MKQNNDIKSGDIVYFKVFQKSLTKGSQQIPLQGYGVGLLLAHATDKDGDMQPSHIFKSLGICGLVTFDDIAEFLGEENAKVVIKKFEEKYYKVILDPKTGKPYQDTDAKVLELRP